MRVMFINNHGGGFADHIDVPAGFTVREFFKKEMPNDKPENFLIRVNRQSVPHDQQLQENDRVSITPVKIEGADQVR